LFPLTTTWTIALNNAVVAPPAYDEARGFFPIEGDRIVAYDLTSGRQLWMRSHRVTSEPATGQGLLFIAEPEALVALQAEDGTAAWELPFAEPLAAPLVADAGWLVAATTSGDVLALRASDGHLIWRQKLGAPAQARPSLMVDRMYVATADARIVALRVDSGALVWQQRLGGNGRDILARDERLFVGSQDKYFYCLNTRDGGEEWRWRTGADTVGRAVVDDQTVYFAALDNVLRALNRGSGVQRWKQALPFRPASGPIIAAETLIVSGVFSSNLRAYFAKDGKPAGDVVAPGELVGSAHLLQNASEPLPTVLILTRDIIKGATVLALRRSFEPPTPTLGPLPNEVAVAPRP
jgi:outer membrane protein assembly factor BamB